MQTFVLLSSSLQREVCLILFLLVSPCGTQSASDHYPHLQTSKNSDVVRGNSCVSTDWYHLGRKQAVIE